MPQKKDFWIKTCIYQIFVVILQADSQKTQKMLVTPVRERGYVPVTGNYEGEVYYTRHEFMDELAKQLGQAYGLNDIREAK